MKTLLIISSQGLGENSMAANRLRRMLPSLLEQDHIVHILCPRLGDEPLPDHPQLFVHSFSFITNKNRFWSKVGRKLVYPILGVWTALRIIREQSKVYVVSTIPEIETLMIGYMVKALCAARVRLTLEIRDPFSMNALYGWGKTKSAFYKRLECQLLRRVDGIIFLTPAISDLYLQLLRKQGIRIPSNQIITNGFDPKDYRDQPVKRDGPLRITHIGNFYGDRNPIRFLSLLESFLTQTPAAPACEIDFIGALDSQAPKDALDTLMQSKALATVVRWKNPVDHATALSEMQQTDVNLLITHSAGSEYAIPGKLFEYMGAQKPILAFTTDPFVVNLVTNYSLGWVCRSNIDLMLWFETYLPYPDKVRAFQPDASALDHFKRSTIYKEWEHFVFE